ncbi:WhiB family redox-sensing transcriptional regulator [Spinactinospora alkalitolerans]|uniref:Transcriptional regulator WhiB n=1 Tax=Spinactinospora alkalitolerans TaxID=687207 RepID=A0A852TT53_9ACTN|nr:WhiB family transcriptional regulator [Spinactinospora alkalitolerans]NYE46695.1 WhiB family redox-sensing transcriptional regulator [Spinactinospora alkalitolerans]
MNKPAVQPARYAYDTDLPALDWILQGSCGQTDPEAFHPASHNLTHSEVQAALAVCQACPVLQRCRDYALARPWLTGIWGATTAHQRRRLRRTTAA